MGVWPPDLPMKEEFTGEFGFPPIEGRKVQELCIVVGGDGAPAVALITPLTAKV